MKPKISINRREFLIGSATLLAAAAVGCTPQPSSNDSEIVFPNYQTGNDPGKMNLLVAYASRTGSTAEIAADIAKQLETDAFNITLQPISEGLDISQYQAVILGSAIRYGKWMPEATAFVQENAAMLSQIPTAFFTVCMTLNEDTPENRTKAEEFVKPILDMVTPSTQAIFAGIYDPKKLKFLERLIAKAASMPEGDFRNWDAIHDWTSSLPGKLI